MADLSARLELGAVARRTTLTREFPFEAWKSRYGDEALPLMLVTGGASLKLFTAYDPPIPMEGQTIIALVRGSVVSSPSPVRFRITAPWPRLLRRVRFESGRRSRASPAGWTGGAFNRPRLIIPDEPMEIALVLLIAIGAAILFATEKLTVDVVALLVLSALLVTGLVSPTEAISGFSNPATVTVAAMFVLSAGLTKTGALRCWAGAHPPRTQRDYPPHARDGGCGRGFPFH